MRVGSLFSGCGGLDLGLEAAGLEVAWLCENDPACRKVLAERFPDVPCYDDVRAIDETVPRVVVLAGGFPCQDLSNAGKGEGLSGDRSALWFEMARCIRVLQPEHVIVENVPGIFSKMGSRPGESAFGTVIADLAEAGYVGHWFGLRASDLGACHIRDRVFIVATRADVADARREGRREVAGGAPGDESAAEGRPADGNHVSGGSGPGGLRAAGRAAAPDAVGVAGPASEPLGAERGAAREHPERGTGSRQALDGASRCARASAESAGLGRDSRAGLHEGAEAGEVEPGRLGGSDDGGVEDAPDSAGPGPQGPESARRRLVPAGSDRQAPTDSGDGAEHGERPREEPRERDEDAPDADGEPGEPRGRRRTESGDHPRSRPAQRDGDGLVGEAEPWAPCGHDWDWVDADGFCAQCATEAFAHTDGVGRRLEREPDGEPGLEGPRGHEPDGRGQDDAASADSAGGGRHWRQAGGGSVHSEGGEAPVGPESDADAGNGGRIEWGAYGPSVHRWERILGRPAPRPTDDRGRLQPRFVEWMLGFPDGWVSDLMKVDADPRPDHLSRPQALRMLGNSVQVQCGELVGRILIGNL